MFIDEKTGKLSKPLEKQHKLIIATRVKEYWKEFTDKKTGEVKQIMVGKGSEIVKEICVRKETLDEEKSPNEGIIRIPSSENTTSQVRRREQKS
jgi:hypothetical protein